MHTPVTGPSQPSRSGPSDPAAYASFVAVGDSFTEGMSDLLPDGSYRGGPICSPPGWRRSTPASGTPTWPCAAS